IEQTTLLYSKSREHSLLRDTP
ncbi:hypothetical protein CCACVL1_01320, partial [Corchorus capsularis]